MGCHTWFYRNEEYLNKGLSCEYHDTFRDSGFPEVVLSSLQETIDYIKQNNCTTFDYTYEDLKSFWKKYPDGKIDFG